MRHVKSSVNQQVPLFKGVSGRERYKERDSPSNRIESSRPRELVSTCFYHYKWCIFPYLKQKCILDQTSLKSDKRNNNLVQHRQQKIMKQQRKVANRPHSLQSFSISHIWVIPILVSYKTGAEERNTSEIQWNFPLWMIFINYLTRIPV